MANTGDTAEMARLWIESNVALFIVIVIAAVLLLVSVLTLILYCWCCRRKKSLRRRSRSDSKSTGSNIHVQLQVDSVDADSAVTATVRGQGVLGSHVEATEKHAENLANPEPDYPEQEVQREEIGIQQTAPANSGVEVTQNAELWLHSRPPTVDIEAEPTPMDRSQVRLPRTEVVLATELQSWKIEQQQQQQPVQASPVLSAAPKTRAQPGWRQARPHGSRIYQSDDNEITIVDSDFSDYEDSGAQQTASAAAAAPDSLWETLPNKALQPPEPTQEEPRILAVDRHGDEYKPAPAAEQGRTREARLAQLDKTLDVFAQQADAGASARDPLRDSGWELDSNAVDEQEILPIDRSQMPL